MSGSSQNKLKSSHPVTCASPIEVICNCFLKQNFVLENNDYFLGKMFIFFPFWYRENNLEFLEKLNFETIYIYIYIFKQNKNKQNNI